MVKKPYDEVGVLRVLTKNRGLEIGGKNGKMITVDDNQTSVGNGTWGKIDYLCKMHGYTYFIVKAGKKRAAHYDPTRGDNLALDQGTSIVTDNVVEAKIHPSKINMANMTKIAMRNSAIG